MVSVVMGISEGDNDMAMSARYRYVKRLADSAQERARKAHLEYQSLEVTGESDKAAGKLNDYFYWIGHANAYRGITLQIDFMETQEMAADEEFTCP